MSRLLGVGALQMPTVQGNVNKNLEVIEQHVQAVMTMNPWIKLVCTNELCKLSLARSLMYAAKSPRDIISILYQAPSMKNQGNTIIIRRR